MTDLIKLETALRQQAADLQGAGLLFGKNPQALVDLLDKRDKIIADLLAAIRIAVRAAEIDERQVALVEALQKYAPVMGEPVDPPQERNTSR